MDKLKDRVSDDSLVPNRPKTCAYYGLFSECASPLIGTIINLEGGLRCYQKCGCPADYIHTNASCGKDGAFVAGGPATQCDGKSNVCFPIACPSGTQVNINCPNGQRAVDSGVKSGKDACLKCEADCPKNLSCEVGCRSYSKQSGCEDVCTDCKPVIKECPNGSWNLESYWCGGALKCFF